MLLGRELRLELSLQSSNVLLDLLLVFIGLQLNLLSECRYLFSCISNALLEAFEIQKLRFFLL